MNDKAHGIWITEKIARVLNRKMKEAGYPTTIKKLSGKHGISVINDFAGMSIEDQKEINEMIVSSYDDIHPQDNIYNY